MAFLCVHSGFLVLAVAAFFHTLSIASSYWAVVDDLNHSGLWLHCECDDCKFGGQSVCRGLSNVPGVLTGVRILAGASLSFILIAYFLSVFGYVKARIRFTAAAAVVTLIIAGALAASLAVYSVNYSRYAGFPKDDSGSLGWAFFLGCVGVVFHVIAASCFFAETVQAVRQSRGYYPTENALL